MGHIDKMTVGIVLYNPDYERLKASLDAIAQQFTSVILYNNGGCNVDLIYDNKPDNMELVLLGDGVNRGIAAGLNAILKEALAENNEWVITLDQDSVIPGNMREEYQKWTSNDRTAIICPQCIDKRRKYMHIKETPRMEKVQMCITSGSCMNIKIWKRLGGVDEWLFIDLVDNDYCKRVVLSGYEIIRLNNVILMETLCLAQKA